MRLVELQIEGFGKLRNRTFAFDPLLTVVYGPNEAGKSTLAAAIVATLYGTARRRDDWRPWAGGRYAARLRYELADGSEFEVWRDFEDSRGVRVRNRHGEDVTASVVDGKAIAPGAAHLRIPLEVFVNASCVRQGEVAIETERAGSIGASLSRALDGGPKEDAAIGAVQRLDRALAQHVGTKRATVNVPLKRLVERASALDAQVDAARTARRAQDDLRGRVDEQRGRVNDLSDELALCEDRVRSVRAGLLRGQLAALHEIRDHVAKLAEDRAAYDDVAAFASERVPDLEQCFTRWQEREAVASEAAIDAASAALGQEEEDELRRRLADGGSLDDDAFAKLRADVAAAERARDEARAAAEAAASARRAQSDGDGLTGAGATAAALLAVAAAVLGVLHLWWPALALLVAATIALTVSIVRINRKRAAVAVLANRQAQVDAATSAEATTTKAVATALAPLGVATFDELAERRRRARELLARRDAATGAARKSADARSRADAAAAGFDALASALGLPDAPRADRLVQAKERARRRLARDGVDLQLGMLSMQRANVLGNDDEVSLERELQALLAAGVLPTKDADGGALRALERQREELARRLNAAERDASVSSAQLGASEAGNQDLAALEEEASEVRSAVERLERFEAAIALARDTIRERAREAHEKFARRLTDYAADTFERVTGGRYCDLRIAPATLELTVRVPETGELRDLTDVSLGTREQAYLVVRFAMARMFAEGSEVLPLMLDDPFVSWDAERIARALTVLRAATRDSQVILFTANDPLARAASAGGAARIDLKVV